MKSAVGLEVAGAVGEYLLLARQRLAAAQPEPRRRVGMDALGVDSLVNHADAVVILHRILIALPFCRGVAPIGSIQTQHVSRVPYPDAQGVFHGDRKFRIKIEIGARRAIEKLEITKQGNAGPNVLDEQKFAPAGMPDDDVGGKPFLLQAFAQPGDGEAVHDPAIQIVHIGLRPRQDRGREIFEHANAGDLVIAALGNKYDGMSSILEVPYDMRILSRKVLMDE